MTRGRRPAPHRRDPGIQRSVEVVVTGGGTAGHVLPALAIADALVAAGHDPERIHYVGTRRGIEAELVPPTGYAFTLLDVVGLQRSLTWRNLPVVPKAMAATARAFGLLGRLCPSVVVNLGGYGSFPATFAARLRRIPTVVVSYDRRPGLVSRLLARSATATATAFEGSRLPRAQLTGAPVRRLIRELDRDAQRTSARAALDLPVDRFVVGVMCGSLGARAVNDVIAQMVEVNARRTDLAVHHVVGARFVDQSSPARSGVDGILYRVIGYEPRVDLLYAAADLMLTRAGAGTVAELAAAGVPSILVPWPDAADDHQLDNARHLTDRDAAILVEHQDLTVDRLVAEIDRFIDAPEELRALARRARAAGAIHRGDSLVTLIQRVAAGCPS